MSNLKMFIGFLRLADAAANELGLKSLTASDKKVLLFLWEMMEHSEQKNQSFKITFSDFEKNNQIEVTKISKGQFYKSLNTFIKLKYLRRIGSARSAMYRFTC